MKSNSLILFFFLILSISGRSQSLSTVQLKDSIQRIIIEKGIPGGIITVVTKDSVLFQSAFGYADIEEKVKVQEGDLFKIASLTKTFTAMAVMHLVNEGKLSLDDELKLIAPEIPFTNKWENTHPVKIKHLLEHKSGFSDYSFAALANRYNKVNDHDSFEKILSFENSLVCNWKPGLVTVYSNPAYAILGYIIEKKSGKPYKVYLKDEILEPLGMGDSGFVNDSNLSRNTIVNGYTKIDGEVIKVGEIPRGSAEGGLISNTTDMTKFLQYFLDVDLQKSMPLLGLNGVADMERLHTDFDVKNNIKTGYNLALEDRIFGEKEFVFKGNSGLIDGFVSNFIYSRELDIGVFVSTNLFMKSNRAIVDLVINNYCESITTEDKYKVSNADISKFRAWEGAYRELNDSQEIWNFINFVGSSKSIEIDGNDLVIIDRDDGIERYQNVGGNAFLQSKFREKIPTVYLTEYDGEKSVRYYERTFVPTNKSYFTLLRLLLVFSLTILLINLGIFIVNLIIFPFKRSAKPAIYRSFRLALPFLIIGLSVYLGLSNLSFDKIPILGNLSITSFIIFILTSLFPFICLWQIYLFSKEKKQLIKIYAKIFWSFVVFANIFICVYCVFMGWFAVRFWI